MEIFVLGICGSPIKGGNTEAYLEKALKAASGCGARTELVALAGRSISECRHCNFCIRKQTDGVFCALKDDMDEIYPKVLAADALLVASPAYFGRLSGLSAIFVDRLRAFVFGNLYGGKMKNKVGGAMAVAWSRTSGIETTLLSLDYAFLAMEMILSSVHHEGVLYGAGGFSSIEGSGAFDRADKKLVLRDQVGLKSAKALGTRAVELARLIAAGKKSLE